MGNFFWTNLYIHITRCFWKRWRLWHCFLLVFLSWETASWQGHCWMNLYYKIFSSMEALVSKIGISLRPLFGTLFGLFSCLGISSVNFYFLVFSLDGGFGSKLQSGWTFFGRLFGIFTLICKNQNKTIQSGSGKTTAATFIYCGELSSKTKNS